jgi:protein phosphatase
MIHLEKKYFTGIGKRKENQDYGLYKKWGNTHIFVLCDGMGGYEGGQAASKYCCEYIINEIKEIKKEFIDENDIKELLQNCHKTFRDYVSPKPHLHEAGSTVLFVMLDADTILTAWLGDTVMFVIRDNRIIYKTKPHNLASEQNIKEQYNINFPKNVITKCIKGNIEDVYPDTDKIQLEVNDVIFMFTDGVLESINEEDMIKMAANCDIEAISRELVTLCKSNSKDNYSGFVIRIGNAGTKSNWFMSKINKIISKI